MPKKFTIPTYLAFGWLTLAGLMAIFGSFLPVDSYQTIHGDFLDAPPLTGGHLFGVDSNGYDIFSGIINGARLSLFVAIFTVGIGGFIGSFLGVTGAYFRGRYDSVVSTGFNVVLSVPNLVLALALVAVLATNVDVNEAVAPWRRLTTLMISLTIVIIPILGRIARAATLAWSGREFVTAARLDGASEGRIIFRHMLPSFSSHIIASISLAIPAMILAETSLSFLGLGLQPPTISWGVLLREAQNIRSIATAPWLFAPGAAVVLAVMALNFLGDGLRDASDPYNK